MHSYTVKVTDNIGAAQYEVLEPAIQEDMPTDWTCNWVNFWNRADFGCEAIIKLSSQGRLLGLLRFALYPYIEPYDPKNFEYVEILQLETLPRKERLLQPIGLWLIWYAVQIALDFCPGQTDGTLLRLDATKAAISYYREKVMMEGLGWVTIAPGKKDMLSYLLNKGRKSFLKDSRVPMESLTVHSDDNSWMETVDDEVTAGSKQWMSHQERQAFIKSRTYSTEPTELSQ